MREDDVQETPAAFRTLMRRLMFQSRVDSSSRGYRVCDSSRRTMARTERSCLSRATCFLLYPGCWSYTPWTNILSVIFSRANIMFVGLSDHSWHLCSLRKSNPRSLGWRSPDFSIAWCSTVLNVTNLLLCTPPLFMSPNTKIIKPWTLCFWQYVYFYTLSI